MMLDSDLLEPTPTSVGRIDPDQLKFPEVGAELLRETGFESIQGTCGACALRQLVQCGGRAGGNESIADAICDLVLRGRENALVTEPLDCPCGRTVLGLLSPSSVRELKLKLDAQAIVAHRLDLKARRFTPQ